MIAAFLYMAFSVEPLRPSPSPSQNQQDRHIGAAYSESNDRPHCNDSLKALWRCATKDPIAWFTFCLVIATAILATVAFGQAALFLRQLRLMREGLSDAKIAALAAQDGALAAKDSADTAKLTMIARDRAYVYYDGFRWVSHFSEETGRYFWRIRPRWINSGNTPTRNLAVHVDYEVRDDPLPDDFIFSYVRGIPAMISPHGVVESKFRDVPADELVMIKDRKKFFYAWGTAAYRDVFPGTPDRVTKFCVVATDVTGEPDKEWNEHNNPLEIILITYPRHNCADEDCDCDA